MRRVLRRLHARLKFLVCKVPKFFFFSVLDVRELTQNQTYPIQKGKNTWLCLQHHLRTLSQVKYNEVHLRTASKKTRPVRSSAVKPPPQHIQPESHMNTERFTCIAAISPAGNMKVILSSTGWKCWRVLSKFCARCYMCPKVSSTRALEWNLMQCVLPVSFKLMILRNYFSWYCNLLQNIIWYSKI